MFRLPFLLLLLLLTRGGQCVDWLSCHLCGNCCCNCCLPHLHLPPHTHLCSPTNCFLIGHQLKVMKSCAGQTKRELLATCHLPLATCHSHEYIGADAVPALKSNNGNYANCKWSKQLRAKATCHTSPVDAPFPCSTATASVASRKSN